MHEYVHILLHQMHMYLVMYTQTHASIHKYACKLMCTHGSSALTVVYMSQFAMEISTDNETSLLMEGLK